VPGVQHAIDQLEVRPPTAGRRLSRARGAAAAGDAASGRNPAEGGR
jgi:hypothetical protein